MINILKIGNAIVIDFTDNDKYLHNGTIEVAPNELMVVIDKSDMATFKKMSNGDTLFGLLINLIQIQGEAVTKDNIIDKFGIIGFTSGGGGGTGGAVDSVNGQTGDVIITAASLGAISKTDADAAYASKEELASKADTSTVEALNGEVATNAGNISNLTTKVNEDSGKIATLNTKVDNKLDTLVSGTNIKTVNGESILGEGNLTISGGGGETITVDAELSETSENPVQNKVITDALNGKLAAGDYATIYSVEDVSGEVATLSTDKQDNLVSGTNIKTINGESVLGSGDLTISGGSEPRTWEVHIDYSLTSDRELNPTPVGWSISEFAPAFGDIIKFPKSSGTFELVVTGKGPGNLYLLSSASYDGGYLFAIGVDLGALYILRTMPVTKDVRQVLIGSGATGAGDSCVAIGVKANSGDYAIAIGDNVAASETGSINIGNKIKVNSAGFSYTGKNGEVNLDDALVKDTEMSDTSENAVQNKVIKAYIDSLVGNILTQLLEINGTN